MAQLLSSLGVVVGPGTILTSDPSEAALAVDAPAIVSSASVPSSLPVDAAPSNPTGSPLLRLPPEIIELIALEFDILDHLLAVAATCRALHALLHPQQTRWFRIRCGADQTKLWRHLINHPRLARNLRCLVLDSRLTPQLPPGMADASLPRISAKGTRMAKDNAELLLEAIERMGNLTKLVYRLASPLATDDFWKRVWHSCPRLRDVEWADCSSLDGEAFPSSPLAGCRGLKRLVWFSSAIPADLVSIVAGLGSFEEALFDHCPDLEELRFQYTNPRVRSAIYGGVLISRAHWPKLRVLELSRFHAGAEEEVAAFCERHPALEVLKIDQIDATSGRYIYLDNISDEALPNLHTFEGGIDNAITILASPLRPIRRLRGIQFDTVMLGARRPANWSSTPQGQCLMEGLAQAAHLEELCGEFALVISDKFDLARLFEACKRVRVLKLRCNVAGFLETYLPAFAALSQLEVLQFPVQQLDVLQRPPATGSLSLRCYGSADTFVASLKHKVRMLASVCPRLAEIDFGASGGSASVVRYPDSTEVSEVVLAGRDAIADGEDPEVEQTRAAAAPYYP
ncbi:hypothetical protein ACQY0O_003477 [Thecaphora frezii]